MAGIGEWIARLKQNRGFGVQSPSDFHFVTQVLGERLPYYAYEEINSIAAGCKRHSAKHCRMLFRITNYFAPKSIIVAGSGQGATLCAMAAARPSAAIAATGTHGLAAPAKEMLQAHPRLQHTSEEQLPRIIENSKHPLLVYVGDTDNCEAIIEAAIGHAQNDTVIIVDGIRRTPARLQCWSKAAANAKATITYDMYSTGLLLFDNKRYKQHYTLKK